MQAKLNDGWQFSRVRGADTGYGSMSTDSYRYGDDQETLSGDAALDYVIDILDGDVEIRSDGVELYVPLDIST